jgi:CBS domain-containing protein
MASPKSATPLVAINAVAIDTETTSLDTNKARFVQMGAVRLKNGRLLETDVFDTLVNPQEGIPDVSTRVHGITNADVRLARTFKEMHGEFERFVGQEIVIGHSVGFDLAIWRNEARRAGVEWPAPRALDTRLLAEIANPRLPGFSLEIVTAWLGIEEKNRHSALGDALLAARVFLGLVPHLRERNIRTVAEAEAACGKLSNALEEQVRAGWVEPVRSASGERSLAKIDSYPYRHRVKDVMSSPPLIAPNALTLGEAARLMTERKVSSLFLADAVPTDDTRLALPLVGVITERDVLRAVGRGGGAALDRPVSELASKPLAAVPEEAFLYRAIGRMARLKIRHLAVVDDANRLVGALSQRDLLKMRAEEAISLGDEIDTADGEAELAAAWSKLPVVAASLVHEGVPAHDVAGVISRELGALTRRAAQLSEAAMRGNGKGEPPCPYAVLVLGSGGRGESLLAADQDNAIVFADGAPGEANDQWFEAFATHMAQFLNAAGLPSCKGGVMAKNPAWRGSLDTWRHRIEGWVHRSKPEDLLAVDIFFDLRAVHGDVELARTLTETAYELGSSARDFAKLLAETAGDHKPPLTFLGGIKADDGRVDLKVGALLPIVSTARVLAIRHHVIARATADRIGAIRDKGLGAGDDLSRLIEVHRLVLHHVLNQQLDDVEHGVPLSAKIAVKRLTRPEADDLKTALGRLSHLSTMTKDLLFADAT